MPNQVLFISIDGMTDQLGQSQVLPYLIGLSKKGYSISIVSCEKELNFKKNKETVFAMMTEYNIAWHYCFYSTKVPFISQLKNFFILKRLAIKEVKSKKINILHCRSYITAFIGLQLKNKFKTKIIFDMRGFWADERIDGNIWNLRNPIHAILYKYFKRKEIELVENADYIVTLTNNAKNEIESWQLKSHLKIEVIPCCADIDHFTISSNEEKLITRSKLNIPENFFVIGYLGSIGTWYMLDEMLDFFKELQKEKPNSIFFFITNDDELGIRNVAELKGISSKCVIVKSAKREEVPVFISCFDIGLFFIKPLYSKKGSSPTKLAELLACGIPIISNMGIGDCDTVIVENQVGVAIPNFTVASYQKAINSMETFLSIPAQHFRDVALNNFSLEKGIESYSVIYDYLLLDK
jgi:glycosyltransferase involved in cell wall biosynthesis